MNDKLLTVFQKTFENELLSFLEKLGLKDARVRHYPEVEDFVEKIINKAICVEDWSNESEGDHTWEIQELDADAINLKDSFFQLQEKFNAFCHDVNETFSEMENSLCEIEGDIALLSD